MILHDRSSWNIILEGKGRRLKSGGKKINSNFANASTQKQVLVFSKCKEPSNGAKHFYLEHFQHAATLEKCLLKNT